jgi:hypothetical protein
MGPILQSIDKRWFWGIIYVLGLVWLYPSQPLRFTSPLIQVALTLGILLAIPVIMAPLGRCLHSRAQRLMFNVTLFLLLACTVPVALFSYIGYISDVQMGGKSIERIEALPKTNAVLPTNYGFVRAVKSGGGLDPRSITVYLDRPILLGIVRREILATVENTSAIQLRLRSQDSLEIDLPERSEIFIRKLS